MKGKILFAFAAAGLALMSSCSKSGEDVRTVEVDEIQLDGSCVIYSLENSESAGWSIVEVPEWITPVKSDGDVQDDIELYVESNSLSGRAGVVAVKYANGKTVSTRVSQSAGQTEASLQRSYAVGWGFDVTTYMDSRGLKDQIFNTQKVLDFNNEAILNNRSTETDIMVFYGESYSSLNSSLNARLNLDDLKIGTFELGLEGAFGSNAMSDSKRIFSWMRGTFLERKIEFTLDVFDVQENNLFTRDFAEERRKVINADGDDTNVRELIERYGTHYVTTADLGGFLDYYFSSVVEKIEDSMSIQAAISFGYNKMFNIKGDASYEDTYKNLNTDKIETFSVKGGDAIDLTNKVISGTMDNEALQSWRASLRGDDITECQLELIRFDIYPIWDLFPDGIDTKIKDYIERVMYYRDLPVTRAKEFNR